MHVTRLSLFDINVPAAIDATGRQDKDNMVPPKGKGLMAAVDGERNVFIRPAKPTGRYYVSVYDHKAQESRGDLRPLNVDEIEQAIRRCGVNVDEVTAWTVFKAKAATKNPGL